MSDDFEPTPQQLEQMVEITNTISTALLVATVRQVVAPVGTIEHTARTSDALRLSQDLTSVPHLSPEDAVFVAARTSAAVIAGLCSRFDIDPVELAATVESSLFFAQNPPD